MSNISSLVNVEWFLGELMIDLMWACQDPDVTRPGIPFNDTTNWRLDVVKYSQAILGDRLLGFQAGNEPDLFVRHQNRPEVCTTVVSPKGDAVFIWSPGIWTNLLPRGDQ